MSPWSCYRSMGLLCIVLLSLSIPFAIGDLQVGFYNSSCPQAESVVLSVVSKHFATDQSVTAAFLRMYFHDCFVRVMSHLLFTTIVFALHRDVTT